MKTSTPSQIPHVGKKKVNPKLKKWAADILAVADVQIDGGRPWDIQVHDDRLYSRVLRQGTLGLGEAYIEGWWDVEQLDEFFNKVLRADLGTHIRLNFTDTAMLAKEFIFNLQTKSRSFTVGEKHYDVGNDLYEAMLDKRLTYTCGYWKDATNLDQAQENKLDLVCRKIGLKAGDHVWDIGCGWGSFLKFAAEKYGAKGTGVTISKEQIDLANKLKGDLPIEYRFEDYRDTKGKFDHVISLGMFEHVGSKNYRTYMKKAAENLKDDGYFLLHTIAGNAPMKYSEPFISKYIFPNSQLPAVSDIGKAIEGIFTMEDWHNFGPYYDLTLMAWFHNFDKAWPELKHNYSPEFYRMWKYYLLSFAGSFRSRYMQLWQIVLAKKGPIGGYTSVR